MSITRQITENHQKTLSKLFPRRMLSRLSSSQKDQITTWLSKQECPIQQASLFDQVNVRRVQELYSTLPTLDGRVSLPAHRQNQVRKGSELSPGHSLIFCNPVAPERDLEADATISVSPAPEPFVRRMWAGGSFLFLHPLYLGDEVVAERSVKNIEVKRLDSANPMIIVEQEIATSITSPVGGSNACLAQGPCIIERRSHVYIPISNEPRTSKGSHNYPPLIDVSLMNFTWFHL